ncbi:hypothetical protein ACHAXA_004115 [Cyclostephanos tholiformis]|uniref:Nucleoside phosphatase GDA1/CD39 n=1 Tax=Cyclostephanos tholiformis TaxID=382380 RepID=A0ABD3SHT5_9STRA
MLSALAPQIVSKSLQPNRHDEKIAKGQRVLPSPFRVVVDAGSTGSRLHIFELVPSSADKDTKSNSDIQRIECLRRGSSKAWTPLSAFAPPSLDDEGASKRQINARKEPLNATHVAHHMLPLFDYASIVIPHEFHSSTPVRIAATAGMRLLSLEDQSHVYDALYAGLLEQVDNGRFVFTNLKRDDIITLSGEREGFYGAIAANYLRGVVDAELRVIVPKVMDSAVDSGDDGSRRRKKTDPNDTNDEGICTNKFGMCEEDAENVIFGPSHHYVPQNMHDVKRFGPLGALDMGGSSTQIVYRNEKYKSHEANEGKESDSGISYSGMIEDDVLPSHLNDKDFFSNSYLSYGVDQFRERLWDLWVTEADETIIYNPCSFVGYEMSYKGHNLIGTGNALRCAEQIFRLIPFHDNVTNLDELNEENIESSTSTKDQREPTTKRNMVGGIEHPPLRGKFYGISLYFFTLDCLRELSDPDHPIHVSWPTPSIEELTHALDAFCARQWQGDLEDVQHEAHEHTRAEVLPHRCLEAVYMVTLLRDGFGFHPTSRDVTFVQWVEGNEVEWSLGMTLSEFAEGKGR